MKKEETNNLKREYVTIEHIPALLLGDSTSKLYLYVHGQGGNKEEANLFANLICPLGWQVLSIDLPEHGTRMKDGKSVDGNTFDPWHAVPEVTSVIKYCKANWNTVSLYLNSIGTWFTMLSILEQSALSHTDFSATFEHCIMVSPIVDMDFLITQMMQWASVSEERLEKEQEIATDFGQTLSWKYRTYAKKHPINKWNAPTHILYGETDHLMPQAVIEEFSQKFHCDLTVMKGGEHWFHTEEEIAFLTNWLQNIVK